MATYAIYIKDLPDGTVEVHRQLESGIHGARSAAGNLALYATEAIKRLVESQGDSIQNMTHTTILAALAKATGATP